MKNPYIGVTPLGQSNPTFINITQIVAYTRSTNHVHFIDGGSIQLEEAQMLRLLDFMDSFYEN